MVTFACVSDHNNAFALAPILETAQPFLPSLAFNITNKVVHSRDAGDDLGIQGFSLSICYWCHQIVELRFIVEYECVPIKYFLSVWVWGIFRGRRLNQLCAPRREMLNRVGPVPVEISLECTLTGTLVIFKRCSCLCNRLNERVRDDVFPIYQSL